MSEKGPVIIDLEPDVIDISSDDDSPKEIGVSFVNAIPMRKPPPSDRAWQEYKDGGSRWEDAPRSSGTPVGPSSSNKATPKTSLYKKSSPQKQSKKRTLNIEPRSPETVRGARFPTSDRLEDAIQAVAQERVSEPSDRRRCTGCKGVDEVCDGNRPCSRCAESGFACRYDEGSPPASKHEPTSLPGKSDEIHNVNTAAVIETAPNDENGIPSSPDAGNSSLFDTGLMNPPRLPPAELGELEHIPQNSSLPRSLEEVRQVIRAHQDNLNAHREYLLGAQLVQSRIRSQQKPTIPDQKITVNPFNILLKQKEAHDLDHPAAKFTHIQIKVRRAHRGSRKNIYQTIALPITSLPIDAKAPILPKYKSIGRLGTSFLSRNVHTLLSLPYFAENEGPDDSAAAEREAELKERYRNNDIGLHENPFRELRQQRRCLERVWYWSAEFAYLLSELQLTPQKLENWLRSRKSLGELQKCKTCNLTCELLATAVLEPGFEESAEEALRCAQLSNVFTEMTSIPVWHFVDRTVNADMEKTQIKQAVRNSQNDMKSSLCSICFAHNCLTHGSYIDGDWRRNERGPFINDPELENNTRVTAVLGNDKTRTEHICGLFCCGLEQFSTLDSRIIGLDHAGNLSGKYNNTVSMVQELASFRGTTLCGKECFLELANREHAIPLSEKQKVTAEQLVRSMVKLYGKNLRLPCMIAKIAKFPCSEALRQVIRVHQDPPHPRNIPITEDLEAALAVGKRKVANRQAGYITDNSGVIDTRGPIVPCSHSGPCLRENGCRCARENAHCEWFCGCEACGDGKCKRRFRGCNCKGPCFKDSRCECWSYNRECDPWLCKSCGVLEVLDPPNKYRPEIRIGRCQNNKIQLDLPAKTIKAPSEVQGWGLFAGEDLDKHAFIGEYKGEIISAGPMEESDRRGVVYHNHGLEYLFMMNTHQEMDGSTFGNKTRFMNNSQLDAHINVLAKKLIANGVPRIMFYTARPVKAGEELLYNYNYPDDITKHFWEKGDRLQQGENGLLMPVSKPRLPSARVARDALGKTDDEQQPARKRVQMEVVHRTAKVTTSRRKRKRVADNGEEDNDSEDVHDKEIGVYDDDSPSESAEQLLSEFQKPVDRVPAARADSSDEDYEEEADDQDSPAESESESEIDGTDSEEDIRPRRRRTAGPGLGTRFGGQALREAAATRRERAARGEKY